MTEEEVQEFEKCKNDIYYFYDKYVVIKGYPKLSPFDFYCMLDSMLTIKSSSKLKARNNHIITAPSLAPFKILSNITSEMFLHEFEWLKENIPVMADKTETYLYNTSPIPEEMMPTVIIDTKQSKFIWGRTGTKQCNMSALKRKRAREKRKKK